MSPRLKVLIVGGGTMGQGLAVVFSGKGHEVTVVEKSEEVRDRILPFVQGVVETLMDCDPARSEELSSAPSRIFVASDLTRAADADLVIEAISENVSAKAALFAELNQVMSVCAILATNTSYLDLTDVVPAARCTTTLAAHWYSPPYIIDLVDIAPFQGTSTDTVKRMVQIVEDLGQKPLKLKKFIPGYLANRIQAAIAAEAYALVDAGVASPAEVDFSIVHGLALRLAVLGHFGRVDFAGLGFTQLSLANRPYESPPKRPRSEALDALLALGFSGVDAGRGFYEWGSEKPAIYRERDQRIIALKRIVAPLAGRKSG